MLERANGQFTIEGQVEDIFGGISGATRIARISQTCLFTGALEGESIAEYTAVLPREGDGSVQGFQRISGTLEEREGSFVVCVTGAYAKGQLRGTWAIVPKSGSGDFLHIRGNGTFAHSAGKSGNYKLEFDLRKPRKPRVVDTAEAAETSELVPGIDIVADEAMDRVPVASEPIDASPPRRRRTKAEPVVEAPPVVVAESLPKRPRTSRGPAIAITAPVVPGESAPKTKRARKKADVVEQSDAPSKTAEERSVRSSRRSRTKSEPGIAPVEPVAAPAVETPRKQTRKAPKTVLTEPATAESNPVPEPNAPRRKKATIPPEPVPLPTAQHKPARTRKAKAA